MELYDFCLSDKYVFTPNVFDDPEVFMNSFHIGYKLQQSVHVFIISKHNDEHQDAF